MKKKCFIVLVACIMALTMVPVISYGASGVYVTATGSRYHSKANCYGLRNAKTTHMVSLSEAKSQGYTPCKICGSAVKSGASAKKAAARFTAPGRVALYPVKKQGRMALVAWKKPKGKVTAYQICVRPVKGKTVGKWKHIRTVKSKTTKIKVRMARKGVVYQFAVRAVNGKKIKGKAYMKPGKFSNIRAVIYR